MPMIFLLKRSATPNNRLRQRWIGGDEVGSEMPWSRTPLLQGLRMESLAIDYTVGGGASRAERQELIIYSWDREAEPAGLF